MSDYACRDFVCKILIMISENYTAKVKNYGPVSLSTTIQSDFGRNLWSNILNYIMIYMYNYIRVLKMKIEIKLNL